MYLTRNTAIQWDRRTPPVENAVRILRRDLSRTLTETSLPGGTIRFRHRECAPESYEIAVSGSVMTVSAGDDLGYLYGALEISRRFLGVLDLWFWNDQRFVPRSSVEVPEGLVLRSAPVAVRYRGWFINDEVLLLNWQVNGDPDEPWRMAFEALLRLGGNLVIPGTDRSAHKYRPLASSFGLIITHHHAEPLGAEMFARRYPDLKASYREYPALFQGLWREAVEAQRDMPVVYNIGFRGQGDTPFWSDDPAYDTPQARGALLSSLIREQYDLVKSLAPQADCCTNLYGECMELYRDGFLHLPEDVIRVWADNGYGRMVSRRQGNHDPRVSSMPEGGGRHGIYYHISFYDLQAAGHITTLPNGPEFVAEELTQVLAHNGGDFWIVNCSNIKPHVYLLSLTAELWKHGSVDPAAFGRDYFAKYYDAGMAERLLACQQRYWQCAPAFGPHRDQHGAEQLPVYAVRILAAQYLADRTRPAPAFLWACRGKSLAEQIAWCRTLFPRAAQNYGAYEAECRDLQARLPPEAAELFADSVFLQARLLHLCYSGAALAMEAMERGLAGDNLTAFRRTGEAREAFLLADSAMLERQHGKWQGFYANDCLTDIRFTASVLEGLLHLFRTLGDGPDYWRWQRRFNYGPDDRRVVLLTTLEHRLTDLELYEKMKALED